MRYLIIIIFLSIKLSAQEKNVIVVDSITKKTIPYANIKVLNSNYGFYTNDYGSFSFSNKLNKDSISISCLGYKTLIMMISQVRDTIFIKPNTLELDEITISSKKQNLKSKKIGFKKINSGWFGTQNLQVGVIMKPNKKNTNTRIEKIIIPFRKKIYGRKKYDYRSIFKLSIFSVLDNKPNLPLIEKPIIINYNQDSNKFIEIDISQEFIYLKKEGVFICLEQVGEINESGEVIDKRQPLPGLGFSTIKPKEFLYINSFYKQKHSTNWLIMEPEKIRLENKIYLGVQLMVSYSEN